MNKRNTERQLGACGGDKSTKKYFVVFTRTLYHTFFLNAIGNLLPESKNHRFLVMCVTEILLSKKGFGHENQVHVLHLCLWKKRIPLTNPCKCPHGGRITRLK